MAEVYLHKDEIIVVRTEDYYEEQASQEEMYLEETEEDLRMILESEELSPLADEGLSEQREHAAEELITGDSDAWGLREIGVNKADPLGRSCFDAFEER